MGRHGWRPDPYGIHERRYFSVGHPTSLVRDGTRESFDEPPGAVPAVAVQKRRSDRPTEDTGAPPSAGAGAGAGWYDDPSGSKTLWYWSGSAWTKCLQQLAAASPVGPPAPDIAATGIRPRIGRRTKIAVTSAAAVIALAALVGATTSPTIEVKSVAPSLATQPPTTPGTTVAREGLSTWVHDHTALLTALYGDAVIEGAAMNSWSSSDYADESSLLVAAQHMNADIETATSVPTIPDTTAQRDWTQWYTALGTGQAAVLRAISESSSGGVLTAQGFLHAASSSFGSAAIDLMALDLRFHELGVEQPITSTPATAPPAAGTHASSAD